MGKQWELTDRLSRRGKWRKRLRETENSTLRTPFSTPHPLVTVNTKSGATFSPLSVFTFFSFFFMTTETTGQGGKRSLSGEFISGTYPRLSCRRPAEDEPESSCRLRRSLALATETGWPRWRNSCLRSKTSLKLMNARSPCKKRVRKKVEVKMN